MLVRNGLLSRASYKGQLTEASDAMCPCRPCRNFHDCGYMNTQGEWIRRMECATRWNDGCGDKPEPEHVVTSLRARKCKRCGVTLTKEQVAQATLLADLPERKW